jgi:hypothetical protein
MSGHPRVSGCESKMTKSEISRHSYAVEKLDSNIINEQNKRVRKCFTGDNIKKQSIRIRADEGVIHT